LNAREIAALVGTKPLLVDYETSVEN